MSVGNGSGNTFFLPPYLHKSGLCLQTYAASNTLCISSIFSQLFEIESADDACPMLLDPAGGRILLRTIDNNGQMMGFAELRCDEGYTVIGVSTAVCLPVVNQWNRVLGTCEGGKNVVDGGIVPLSCRVCGTHLPNNAQCCSVSMKSDHSRTRRAVRSPGLANTGP